MLTRRNRWILTLLAVAMVGGLFAWQRLLKRDGSAAAPSLAFNGSLIAFSIDFPTDASLLRASALTLDVEHVACVVLASLSW